MLKTLTKTIPLGLLLSGGCILSAQAQLNNGTESVTARLQPFSCPSTVPISDDDTVNMKDFGANPNQGIAFDVSPYLDCALAFTKTHGLRAIYFPGGQYAFNTPVQNIDFPITIFGDGKGRTYLYRNFTASTAGQGLLTFVDGANSASVRDLGIAALGNTSHGAAISLIADQNGGPAFMLFSNLYLSAGTGGNWDYTVYINGTAKTSQPIGVRDIDFQNCSVFGAANGAMLLDGVVGFNFVGGGVFQAGGVSNTSGLIAISPSYNASGGVPSYYVNINTTYVAGILMQAALHSHFSAYFPFPITTTSFDSDDIVIGHVEGGVQPNWQLSKYIDPEN